jgi:hypothetical protein
MPIVLNDTIDVQDAPRTRSNVRKLGLPEPPGLAQANSYLCPLGPVYGRAYLCLLKEDLDAIDKESADHKILFKEAVRPGSPLAATEVTVRKLVFVRAACLTAGRPSDPKAVYLAEFADLRRQMHNADFFHGVRKQYNIYAAQNGVTYDSSRDGGAAGVNWTWETLCEDLWTALGFWLGAWPGFPGGFTPDTEPTGFHFLGVSGWLALCEVLERIGAAVAFDPTFEPTEEQGQAHIVQVGAEDDAGFQQLADLETTRRRLLYDAQVIESVRGKLPKDVRVYFNKAHEHYGSEQTTPGEHDDANTDANWLKEPVVTKLETAGGIAGEPAEHVLWDDLPALIAFNGTQTANSLLATNARAADRAATYLRQLEEGGTRLHRIHSGALPFKPGARLKAVAWRQAADGGIVTEIVRHPSRFLRPAEDRRGWEEVNHLGRGHSMQPPDFGPSYPQYPWPVQLVEVTGEQDANGFFPGLVLQVNPDLPNAATREPCWVADVDGL